MPTDPTNAEHGSGCKRRICPNDISVCAHCHTDTDRDPLPPTYEEFKRELGDCLEYVSGAIHVSDNDHLCDLYSRTCGAERIAELEARVRELELSLEAQGAVDDLSCRDITHDEDCAVMQPGAHSPRCDCRAERVAELRAMVRAIGANRDRIEAKLAHLRNLIVTDDIEARRLVGEIKHALGVTEGTEE